MYDDHGQEIKFLFLAEWLVRLPFNQKVLGSIHGMGKSKMHNFLTFQCQPWGSNPRGGRELVPGTARYALS